MVSKLKESTRCARCKADYSQHDGVGTGYARTRDTDERICYDCAADDELRDMYVSGRAMLYLSGETIVPFTGPGIVPTADMMKNITVGNWTGRFKLKVHGYVIGRHNIAGIRTDVWFTDRRGQEWWGYVVGRDTQVVHCRRLKVKE